MKGLWASDVTYTIIYVASLVTMGLITLKFLLSSPVKVGLKYDPKTTAYFTTISLIADLRSWVYYDRGVGPKFNLRAYYGILDLKKITYDLLNYTYNLSVANKTCIDYCELDCKEIRNDDEKCNEDCVNVCNKSVINLLSRIGNFNSTKILSINGWKNVSEGYIVNLSYPYVEGDNIIYVHLKNVLVRPPPNYLPVRNFVLAAIPKVDMLEPYVIHIKLYDMDYLKKSILSSTTLLNPEDFLLASFWFSTYCPVKEKTAGRSCKLGDKLYEVGTPVLITDGYGRYWNGFLVVRIYEWKKG